MWVSVVTVLINILIIYQLRSRMIRIAMKILITYWVKSRMKVTIIQVTLKRMLVSMIMRKM